MLTLAFGNLKDREEYFYVTTSGLSNHRLTTYLLVAFNTDRVTCHQMEAARILEFSVAVCQSWFPRVCLTHFVNCWASFDKCSVRKIYATKLYSGWVCCFSKSVLQDGEVFLSSPCLSLSWGLWGEAASRVERLLTSYDQQFWIPSRFYLPHSFLLGVWPSICNHCCNTLISPSV